MGEGEGKRRVASIIQFIHLFSKEVLEVFPKFDQLHKLVVEVKCPPIVSQEAEHHIQGGIVRVNLVTSCVYVDSAMIRNQIWNQ